MHLLHTPEYRPALQWLVEGRLEPLTLPSGVYTHAGGGLVKCPDGVARTWAEWLGTFPRRDEELLPLTTTHRDGRILLAEAEHGVTFCLDDEDAAPPRRSARRAVTPAPVKSA